MLGDIRVLARRKGPAAGLLIVEDDGVGMDVSAPPRGTGLGAKIIRAMAANLGATIEFDSRPDGPNKGMRATVKFSL